MSNYGKAVLALAAVTAGLLLAAAQKQDQAEVALRAAIDKELIDGDLKAAIEMYKKILARPGGNRAAAAKALLHIGQCQEKLGNAEARKSYEQLLREYPDQREVATEARGRLAALETRATSESPAGLTVRQVWSGPPLVALGGVTPDGRYLTFVDWESGDLAVRDLATGKNRRLTGKGSWAQSDEFAESSVVSPDGQEVAYVWLNHPEGKQPNVSLYKG